MSLNRFIALNAALLAVAGHGGTHVATLDTQQNLIFSVGPVQQLFDHNEASEYCSTLRLGEKDDWRLPTVHELFAIVDHSRHSPAIDPDAFPETEGGYYWSSTPCAWRPGSAAWCVNFDGGNVNYDDHGYECFVRAVRVASPAAGQ